MAIDDDNDFPDAPSAGNPARSPAPAASATGDGALSPKQQPALQRAEAAQPAAQEEYEIVEIDDQGQPINQGAPAAAPAAPQDQGQPQDQDQDQDQQGGDAQRPGQQRPFLKGADRRRAQKSGRERTFAENRALKSEVEALRREIGDLRGTVQPMTDRISEMDMRQARTNLQGLETQLAQTQRDFETIEDQYFDAMSAGERDRAKELGKQRDALAIKKYQLGGAVDEVKKRLDQVASAPAPAANQPRQQPQSPQQPQAPAQLSPIAQSYAEEFQAEHPWMFDPRNAMDRRVLGMVDDSVINDGFVPETQEYWDELRERAASYLPHRFNGAEPAQNQPAPARQQRATAPAPQQQAAPMRRGPAVAAPAAASPAAARTKVVISPQRKEAMIQAGIIDNSGRPLDRKKFDRMMRSFAEYDRANGVGVQ